MMSILYSWKEGLTLLLPRNLKPFVLVTLKSIIECYKVYFKYFWWIPVIALLHAFVYAYWQPPIPLHLTNIEAYPYFIRWRLFFSFTYCFIFGFNTIVVWLATRPSIGPKNGAYFQSMLSKYFLTFIILILINLRPRLLFYALPLTHFTSKIPLPIIFIPPFFGIWHIFTLFFLTDAQMSLKNFFKSFWRALLMLLYNLPVLVIIWEILAIVFIPISFFISTFVPFWCIKTFLMMLSPIIIGIFANMYIRCLTDHYDLYFQQKENESSQGNI